MNKKKGLHICSASLRFAFTNCKLTITQEAGNTDCLTHVAHDHSIWAHGHRMRTQGLCQCAPYTYMPFGKALSTPDPHAGFRLARFKFESLVLLGQVALHAALVGWTGLWVTFRTILVL